MAWRISANDEYLQRAASLPSSTAFTMAGWALVINDNAGTFRYPFSMEDTAFPTDSGNYALLGWSNGNTFQVVTTGGTGDFSASPAASTGWFFWAMTCSGTGAGSLIGYWVATTGVTFNTASRAGAWSASLSTAPLR